MTNSKKIVYGISILIIIAVVGYTMYSVNNGGGGGGDQQCQLGIDGKCPDNLVCDWQHTGKCVSSSGGNCTKDSDCNNGTCGSNKKCICNSPYIGDYCNSICKSGDNTCKNGGICSDQGICNCPNGFTGLKCETKQDKCTKDNCIHGTCNQNGECICTEDKTRGGKGVWANDPTNPNQFCTICKDNSSSGGYKWGTPTEGCNRIFYKDQSIPGIPWHSHNRTDADCNTAFGNVGNLQATGDYGHSCGNCTSCYRDQILCKSTKGGIYAYPDTNFSCSSPYIVTGNPSTNPNNCPPNVDCSEAGEKSTSYTLNAWKQRAGLIIP